MSGDLAWQQRADELFARHRDAIHARTDRLFVRLLVVQWFAAMLIAVHVSPRTWLGSTSSVHLHVWLAVLLGGALMAMPVGLALRRPGSRCTRHMIAVCQMLNSALLIHVTGGRIETHFHIFGSLAFLSFYRDWTVLLTASAVAAADHMLRGMVAPESIYGVVAIGPWRWLEHLGWVVFEDLFLIYACSTSVREMREIAQRTAQLETTNATIEAEVRKRTVELAEARDAALAAARVKSEFLASISHELRTPLNGIVGMTGFLLDGELDREQRERACTVRSCSESLLTLVNDLLDFSKIEAGKIEFERIDHDLQPLVNEVADMLRPYAQPKELEVVTRIAADVPARLHGDPYRLRQVLVNLTSNAVKFTARGTVAIDVRRVRLAGGADGLHFAIADTGIGIPEDRLGRLFEPFSQADASTTRTFGGTGLGLVICKRLVEAMGGSIGVESTPGVGSTFWFTIPLVAAKQPATIATDPPGTGGDAEDRRAALQGLRVLLVEDHVVNQKVAMTMLERLGCHADMVANGLEALQALANVPYDLVLMDCMMPELDGYDATRAIREREAREGRPRLPILALTANAMPTDRERCLEAGMDDHLAKPLRMHELADAMADLMARAGACP